ncbi:ankyrin [Hesseltinella vesiculosa]|uniref:Ankyrin n=1 Tax=Hesseltinella vesiculosa TaxID=101127 RepID=A0A1X2GLJ3_9FUNG|nr:ankyrin [Hesseltinella vesiculosa]
MSVSSSSYSHRHEYETTLHTLREDEQRMNPRECLMDLLDQLEDAKLRQVLKIEAKRAFGDQDRLVHMLQQRSELLEQDNQELKLSAQSMQKRYDKAVREMQFFRKKYDNLVAANASDSRLPPLPASPLPSTSSALHLSPSQPPAPPPLPPTPSMSMPLQTHPPPPMTSSASLHQPPHAHDPLGTTYDGDDAHSTVSFDQMRRALPSRSTTTTSPWASSASMAPSMTNNTLSSVDTPSLRHRQNSMNTIHSTASSAQSLASSIGMLPGNESTYSSGRSDYSASRHQSTFSVSTTTSSAKSLQFLRAQPSPTASSLHLVPSLSGQSIPMTPVRSTTTTAGYTGSSLIQQRRVDPLIFGGADGLWETIAKSKGSDVTVEKIISNFLRRGGSPNTAKQTNQASQLVKYGYGLIHALIVTKAPGSLDLLLQQGANPNAMTLCTNDEDKVSPCYLAAKVGWLAGLQKLVQAGGDLLHSRGGAKHKTVLHVAAEHCHAAVLEYVIELTQGALTLQVDAQGATVLHYACASGHTDLVSMLVRQCHVPLMQPDQNDELPLHWAARHGRLEVVTLLCERFGVDCNAYVPKRVNTPLDLAKAAGHRRLVDYLKGIGALPTKKMDRKREEEMAKVMPQHFEQTLMRHGLFADGDGF